MVINVIVPAFVAGLGLKFYSDINSVEAKQKEMNERIDSLEKMIGLTNMSLRVANQIETNSVIDNYRILLRLYAQI